MAKDPIVECFRAETKIANAIELAGYGQIDGGHHKTWVIDQMVRALLGCPSIGDAIYGTNKKYKKFIIDYNSGPDGPNTWDWDIGIAP